MPGTLVSCFAKAISHFEQPLHNNSPTTKFLNSNNAIGKSRLKANTISIQAHGGHDVMAFGCITHRFEKLSYCLLFNDVGLYWLTSKFSQCQGWITSMQVSIVDIEFSVGFLKNWKPPTAILGRSGIYWDSMHGTCKSIINHYTFWKSIMV